MGHEHVQVKSVIKICRKQERVTFCTRGGHNAAGEICLQRMVTERSHKEQHKTEHYFT